MTTCEADSGLHQTMSAFAAPCHLRAVFPPTVHKSPLRRPSARTLAARASLRGDALPPSAPFRVNEVIAKRYRITRVLGHGASAVTYEAEDSHSRSKVAIKALALARMRDWKDLELFEREADTLRMLSHSAIPNYISFDRLEHTSTQVHIIVQRLAPGTPLQSLIDSGVVLDAAQLRSLLRQLLSVLAYLGSLFPPVVHRDIKPANVVVDIKSDGTLLVSLVDFGAVASTAAAINTPIAPATMIGTLGYMAPELLSGAADARSDLFAAAATVLAAITRMPPADLPRDRLFVDLRRALSQHQRDNLGPAVAVLQRMLAPSPEDRFDSASAALAVLDDLSAAAAAVAAPTTPSATRIELVLNGDTRLPPAHLDLLRTMLHNMRTTSRPRRKRGLVSWLRGRRAIRRPAGTRVHIERDNKLLLVTIPPPGFTLETLYSGLFTAAWAAIVGVWTAGALSSGVGAVWTSLFSTPFWVVGAKLTRATLSDVRGTTHMLVCNGAGDRALFYFRLVSDGPLGKRWLREGDARDLDGVEVENCIVDGEFVSSKLVLVEGTRRYRITDALQSAEEIWICEEINDFLGVG